MWKHFQQMEASSPFQSGLQEFGPNQRALASHSWVPWQYPPNPHCFQVLQVLAPTPGALCCALVLSPSLSLCSPIVTQVGQFRNIIGILAKEKKEKNACYRPANQQERKATNSFQSPAMNSV